MKSNKYWEKRAAKTMYEQMVDVEKTADVMSKAFHRAAVELEKEMQHIFSTFQGDLTEKQARDLLEKADNIDFGNLMDLYNKLPDSPAKEAIMKQLNSPAYKARIARLEQLAKDVEKKSRELYGVQTRQISSVLKDTVSESYYRSVFDIQKNIGFSYEFARMNERNIDVILSRPWSGKHYSERIWGNTEKLTNVLKEELLVGFMTGKSYREMADVVMKEMASGAMDARRLVRTEADFVANQGHKEAYEDAEIEKYQFVGTLDNKTSPMCQELDGKIFPLEKAKVGVNYPPIHPWCRSTTVAYFDDEDDEIVKKLRKRRARDPETGKTYLVPADMTYKQWKKSLEQDGDVMIPQFNQGKAISSTGKTNVRVETAAESEERFRKPREKFITRLESSNGEKKHVERMSLYASSTDFVHDPEKQKSYWYDPDRDVICYNPEVKYFNDYDMDFVFAHELSHRMDILQYQSYNNKQFLESIDRGRRVIDDNKDLISSWFEPGGKYESEPAMSDIISALSLGKVDTAIGHTSDYWKKTNRIPMEIFANISAIDTLGLSSKEDLISVFGDLFEAYKGVLI